MYFLEKNVLYKPIQISHISVLSGDSLIIDLLKYPVSLYYLELAVL